MALSNGHDSAETTGRRALPDHTTFVIGRKEVQVPALTLWAMEYLDPTMTAIQPNMPLRDYSNLVLRIVATMLEVEKSGEEADPTVEAIEETFAKLRRKIVLSEMRELSDELDDLLLNSGYTMPGEAEATSGAESPNPGTATSTESSPTSQSKESAAETPSKSSVN